MQDRVQNFIENIKNSIRKEDTDLKRKDEINKIINELEIKKTELLLQMGILTYENMRGVECDFEELKNISNKILEIDKIIYENQIQLEEMDKVEVETVCECGYTINPNDKFCSECGSKIEDNNVDELSIICNYCNCNLEENDNYCGCCGNKIK